MRVFAVALGAFLGAPSRFVLDNFISKYQKKPLGIFVVNVSGSFLIGLTANFTGNALAFLAIGFLGAFTTWSTFILDIYQAYEEKRYTSAAINLFASIICGSLAAWIGIHLVQ